MYLVIYICIYFNRFIIYLTLIFNKSINYIFFNKIFIKQILILFSKIFIINYFLKNKMFGLRIMLKRIKEKK